MRMGCSERSRGGGRAGMQSIKGSHAHDAHIMHSYTVIFTHVLSPHTEGGMHFGPVTSGQSCARTAGNFPYRKELLFVQNLSFQLSRLQSKNSRRKSA